MRDEKGNGVLTGLTGISDIVSSRIVEGEKQPCDGELWYRSYEIKSLISGLGNEEFGFEKVAYLLLFGQLPKEEELSEFEEIIGQSRVLPVNFTRDVIMKAVSSDIMNMMTKSILTLASYDEKVTGGGPVSYTHLDVYKRQSEDSGSPVPAGRADRPGGGSTRNIRRSPVRCIRRLQDRHGIVFSSGPDIKKTVSYSHSADFRRKLRFCRCGQNAGIFAGEIPGSVCMSVCGLNRRNAAVAVS